MSEHHDVCLAVFNLVISKVSPRLSHHPAKFEVNRSNSLVAIAKNAFCNIPRRTPHHAITDVISLQICLNTTSVHWHRLISHLTYTMNVMDVIKTFDT